MRNRRSEKMQERDYKVLFLLWKKEKNVCVWISFSRTPEVEMRKRWLSLSTATDQILTEDVIRKKPETLLWKIGAVRREIAAYALQKWKADFVEHGFQVVGRTENTSFKETESKLTKYEKKRVVGISVETLLRNRGCWCIPCKDSVGNKKDLTTRFAVDTATEPLCIRVTEDVAIAFRRYCSSNALTQSQAMASLLAEAKGTGDENLLVRDLTGRLNNASEKLENAHQEIKRLQEALKKEVQEKEYPKKYQAARLQNELLKIFFKRVSSPESPGMIQLKRYSARSSARVFTDRREYTYPEQDGVILLYLEHVAYGKKNNPPLFIYGVDADGNKKKVRWYYKRPDQFGVSIWGSPFLLAGAPWLFAVQKKGDVADMVGSLPVVDVNWSNIKTLEEMVELQEVIEDLEAYITELEQELDALEHEEKNEEYGADNRDTECGCSPNVHESLNEVLRKIEEGNF